MKTIIIVAMTADRVIGRNGRLPWHLPEDLKFFRRATVGHAVIMGRKTFESIGKPLPGRRNIVLTRNPDYAPPAPPAPAAPAAPADDDTLTFAPSLEAALDRCRARGEHKAFIIGGAQIYRLALPVADEMIITWVEGAPVTGDAWFPKWNEDEWRLCGPADPGFPAAVAYERRPD